MRRTTTLNLEPSFAQSKDGTPHGLTLNPEPLTLNLHFLLTQPFH